MLRTAPLRLADAAAIGRFDGTPGADVLDWNLIEPGAIVYLDIAPSAGPIAHRHSQPRSHALMREATTSPRRARESKIARRI